MPQPLQDRVFVVTGGFGVLGQALCGLLVERGARVALIDRAAAPAAEPGADSGRTLALGTVDLGVEGAAQQALARVSQHWQRIDGLVNLAGGYVSQTVAEGSLDAWDRLYAMNLRSAVAATQAVLPHLGVGGRIVNIAALAAHKAGSGMGAYAASKAGVLRFTEALAEELKDRGVTVNALLPSIIDTPANRADMPSADFERWVTPVALSRVVAFLLSDDAAVITGAGLPVVGRV